MKKLGHVTVGCQAGTAIGAAAAAGAANAAGMLLMGLAVLYSLKQ